MLAQRMPQIVPVQSVVSVDRLRTTQSKDTSEKRTTKSRKNKRKDRTPQRTQDDFQRLMMGTISDNKTDNSKANNNRFGQPILTSARTNEQYRPNATITNNDRTGSIVDENLADNKQEYYYRPNNQSLVSHPGEIYSLISGIVDQKFAERQLIEHQRHSGVTSLQRDQEMLVMSHQESQPLAVNLIV